jgi:tetratricopeptide (TPR) repeat protein
MSIEDYKNQVVINLLDDNKYIEAKNILLKNNNNITHDVRYSLLGYIYKHQKMYYTAIEYFILAIKEDNKLSSLYYFVSECYFNTNNYFASLHYLEEVPKDKQKYYNHKLLALTNQKVENYSNAMFAFNIAINYNNNDVSLYYGRGICNFILNRDTDALKDFKECIQRNYKVKESNEYIQKIKFRNRKEFY